MTDHGQNRRMKLINSKTKEIIVPGDKLIIQKGVHAGRGVTFIVGEIVQPTEQEPLGMIKSPKEGIGWKQYYPEVLGCEFKEDNVTQIKDK